MRSHSSNNNKESIMANWIRTETLTRTGANVASALMVLTLGATPSLALAQSASQTPSGCVHYSASGNRFIDNASRSRADIVNDLRNAAAQPSVYGAVDACLAGKQRNLSAQAYQRLASQSPSTFAPLLAGRSSAVKPAPDGYIAAITQAPPFRFTFLDLDPFVPSGYFPALFIPVGVTDDNRVLGDVFSDDGNFTSSVAEYGNGFIKVLGQGFLLTTSPGKGNMGGQSNVDPITSYGQAAIFRDNGVDLVPRVTGEVSSQVVLINDQGVAIVQSMNESFQVTYAVYANGQRRPVDFGVSDPTPLAINSKGSVVGITGVGGGHYRAFKYSLQTGRTQVFEPLAGDSDSWASDINDFEDIAGFSFGGAAEHVGVFSIQTGRFDTFFTEGTPQVPTIGNVVNVSNARSPLVVTSYSEGRSYVIPKKGARIPLGALVDGDPATQGSNFQISGINNFNAMVGNTDVVGAFLIKSKIGR
jgi:hypothetical protein